MVRDAGQLLLVACLGAALVRVPSVASDVRAEDRRGHDVRDVHGFPDTPGMPEGTPELFARIRDTIPDDAPVRLVLRGTNCVALPIKAGAGMTFWIQYHVLPRPLTCDPNARWWVFVGTAPGGAFIPPPGSSVTLVRPTLAIVHLPGPA